MLRNAVRYWRENGTLEFAKKTIDTLIAQRQPGAAHAPISIAPISSELLMQRRFVGATSLRAIPTVRLKPRLSVITDTINSSSLYGGVGTSLILAGLLCEKTGCDLRLITRYNQPDQENFRKMMQLAGINIPGLIEFTYADHYQEQTPIDVATNDLFLTTSWWTTYFARHAIPTTQLIYLLQEDERMFYAHDDDRLRCSEVLNDKNITFVINSQLLYQHFVAEGLTSIAQNGHWFEPSFPRSLFFKEEKPAYAQTPLRFFFYARPNHHRNLFHRGIEVLQQAITEGVFADKPWQLHFVGKDIPRVKLANQLEPIYCEGLSWAEYAALIRTMDLGFSLMYMPHPSYPPLDLAAAGAVVVTNRYGNKQNLDNYCKNILCSEISVPALVATLRQGVALAQDMPTRLANYQNSGLLRDWRQSFAQILQTLEARLLPSP